MITFEYPLAFLLLLVVPIFYLAKKLGLFHRLSFLLTFSDWKGKSFVWKNRFHSIARFLSVFLCLSGIFLLIIALSNPCTFIQKKVFTSQGSEIVFVVDVSPSMAALDIDGIQRLEVAKRTIFNMVKENPSFSYGLVSLASEAALIVPPTMDENSFRYGLDKLKIGHLGDGTALGQGISTGIYHLEFSASEKKSIVLITDGENNSGTIHPLTAAKLAKDLGIVIYTLGIGTFGNVPIEYEDIKTGKIYSGYLDSHFNDGMLKEIAQITGGKYFSIENSAAFLNALNQIENKEATTQSFYLKEERKSYRYDFLLWGVMFVIVAWVISRLYLREVL